MRKTKVANLLLLHYVLLFIITVSILIGVAFFISFATEHLVKSKPLSNLTSEEIMRDDYENIDASSVVNLGGGVQVIDKDYKIVFSKGINPDGLTFYTRRSFTKYLTSTGNYFDKEYYYFITYNEKEEFWLKIEIPDNIVLSKGIFFDNKGEARIINNANILIAAVIAILIISLGLGLIIYSRIASRTFVKPVTKLLSGVLKISSGDYSARVELKSKNEFGELKDAFNFMAEKIEIEQTLRKKSEDNRKRLILDISHDLKNPLASIMGYSEMLLKSEQVSEKEKLNYLKIILSNSQRADSLIGELFQLSKMESADFELKLENIDICEYLRARIAIIIPQLEDSEFTYEVNIPEEEIIVAIDEQQMERVFVNIISNSIKYNKPGTQIKINLFRQGRKVIIGIEDTGIGIPMDMVTEIFEPFVRVDNSRNSKTGGTGLGLAITKAIVERHGGKISLDSSLDNGCKFIIELDC